MKSLLSQLSFPKTNSTVLLIILATSGLLIGFVLILHNYNNIPIGELTRDPIAVVEAPIYTGFFSQAGIFFWAASATVSLFCAMLLYGQKREPTLQKFYFFSGLFVLLLGLDDIFLLHEVVFPMIGISEKAILSMYLIIALSYAIGFVKIILQTDYVLLFIAAFFFGISVILDVTNISGLDPYLWEDGAKMTGIISWFGYLACSAYDTIKTT